MKAPLVSFYGTPFYALVGEEFGDGIMSAIDFNMNLEREPNRAVDRVHFTNGRAKFPYKRS